jgi:hypothetical protein
VRIFLSVFLSKWRHPVVLLMVVVLPVSLFAQESAGAMLHSSGTAVLVNKATVAASIAIFPNDLIETQKDAVARIEATGSTADINPETMVQFESDELVLDHGSVSVNTTRGLRVRVGCLTVTPVNPSDWTQYDVVDVDGKVTVHALKSDVYIDGRSKNPQDLKKPLRSTRDLVRETEQKSREEKCGGAYLKPDRIPGIDGIMNSPVAIWIGGAMVAAVACLGLCRDDDPVSPYKP